MAADHRSRRGLGSSQAVGNTGSGSKTAAHCALFAALCWPWLNPWVPGPSLYIGPWLIAAYAGVVLLALRHHLSVGLVLTATFTAASVSAAIGLLQYAGWTDWAGPWINNTGPGEAFGNLRQRNQFATFTGIGLIALLAHRAARPRPHFPVWSWGVLGLLAAGNAASNSRTGLLTWALILLMLALWQRGRAGLGSARTVGLLLAFVGLMLLPMWLRDDGGVLLRLLQSGSDSRRELWANVITLIAAKPWTGWGPGELAYAHFITLFEGPRFPVLLGNAHNLPLHLAVEWGVPAAVVLCSGVLWAVWRSRPWAETDPIRQAAWAVLAVIAWHSLLEFPLWMAPFQITTLMAVGYLWWSRPSSTPVATRLPVGRRWPWSRFSNGSNAWRFGSAALLAAALTAASLDYHAVSQRYLPAADRSSSGAGVANPPAGGWLFHQQAQFAALTTTALTPGNAAAVHALGLEVLHYSPEPVVIEKVIASAALLGLEDAYRFYALRYQRAYPAAHALWQAAQSQRPNPSP